MTCSQSSSRRITTRRGSTLQAPRDDAELVALRIAHHGPAGTQFGHLAQHTCAEPGQADNFTGHVRSGEVEVDAVLDGLAFRHVLKEKSQPAARPVVELRELPACPTPLIPER